MIVTLCFSSESTFRTAKKQEESHQLSCLSSETLRPKSLALVAEAISRTEQYSLTIVFC